MCLLKLPNPRNPKYAIRLDKAVINGVSVHSASTSGRIDWGTKHGLIMQHIWGPRVHPEEVLEDLDRFSDRLSLVDFARRKEGEWNKLRRCAGNATAALPTPVHDLATQTKEWDRKFRP